MEVKERYISTEGLVLDPPLLKKAHLGQRVQIVINENEIRILPLEQDCQALLDRLEGCLGQESAQEYDFKLKVGGLYESR